jgi:hypothetical protein
MDDVIPINQYSVDLQREIDDAYWLGDSYQAKIHESELEDVKRMIANGELWYPLF